MLVAIICRDNTDHFSIYQLITAVDRSAVSPISDDCDLSQAGLVAHDPLRTAPAKHLCQCQHNFMETKRSNIPNTNCPYATVECRLLGVWREARSTTGGEGGRGRWRMTRDNVAAWSPAARSVAVSGGWPTYGGPSQRHEIRERLPPGGGGGVYNSEAGVPTGRDRARGYRPRASKNTTRFSRRDSIESDCSVMRRNGRYKR